MEIYKFHMSKNGCKIVNIFFFFCSYTYFWCSKELSLETVLLSANNIGFGLGMKLVFSCGFLSRGLIISNCFDYHLNERGPTHIRIASVLWDIEKQCISRSDTA